MTTISIIRELRDYLSDLKITELELVTALPGSILMCMVITDIIRSYNSKPANENRVSYLLSALCKNHFKIPAE